MKISIVTGPTNYIELVAESLNDANQIVSVCSSKFAKEHPEQVYGPYPVMRRTEGTVCMKINLGGEELPLDAETRDALDTTA